MGSVGLVASHSDGCNRGQIGVYYHGDISKQKGADGDLPRAELAVIAAWYIWWQRRQIVKGVQVQTPEKTALSIRVLATNCLRSIIPKGPTRKSDHM